MTGQIMSEKPAISEHEAEESPKKVEIARVFNPDRKDRSAESSGMRRNIT
jgi:hypothetical protein